MLVGGWQDLWDQKGGGAELELEEEGSGQSEGPNAVDMCAVVEGAGNRM